VSNLLVDYGIQPLQEHSFWDSKDFLKFEGNFLALQQ
jgi:hypothetical protein